MNELIHLCRSVAKSELAINRLNKNIAKMTKYCRMTNARVTGLAITGLLITAIIAMHEKKIKELKEQIDVLTFSQKTKTHSTTEGQTEQKGA